MSHTSERSGRRPDPRLTLRRLAPDVLRLVRRRGLDHVLLDVLFKVVAALVLVPLSTWITAQLISTTGRLTVSNAEIAGFLTSPFGMFTAVLAATTALATTFAEGVGHVAIGGGAHFGLEVRVLDALRYVLRRLPALAGLAALLAIVFAVTAVPSALGLVVTYQLLLAQYDIYFVITEHPPAFWTALAIASVLVLGLAVVWSWLYVRWFVVIPVLVFERSSPRTILRRSSALTAGRRRQVVAASLSWVVVGLVAPIAITVLFDGVGKLAFSLVGAAERFATLTAVGILFLYIIAITVVTLIVLVGANLTAFRLYLHARTAAEPAATETLHELDIPASGRTPAVVVGLALAALGAVALVGALQAIGNLDIGERVRVTAHRGSSLAAPENTLSALRQAVADGADVAEIDVQETADGAVVLLHDSDLLRVAGIAKNIWQVSKAELDTLDAGSWFAPEFAGERIPTLEDAIGVARGQIALNIELKFNGHDDRLAERVVAIVQREGFTDQALISSLNYDGIATVRSLAPEIPIGFIVASALGDVTRHDVDFLAVSTRLASRGLIGSARRRGQGVHVWTVNDRRSLQLMLNLGVDNIMTDDPGLLRGMLAERAALSDVEKLLLAFRNWIWSGR